LVNRRYNDYHKMINEIEYKQCKDCLEWFPMNSDNFGVANKNKDKYNMLCIKCHKEYGHTNYINNKEHIIKKFQQWRKDNPEWYKKLMDETNAHPSDKTKETRRVLSQTRRDNGEYYDWLKDNPDKRRLYSKNHRDHDITNTEWQACLKIFNDECAYCGLPKDKHIAKRKDTYFIMGFHKEHVDDKGYNDLRNAIPSCRICNSSKHQFTIEEWYLKQTFFSQERLDKIYWWTTEGYKDYIEIKIPYNIIKKRNIDNNKFHHELWSVDEKRNMIECIDTKINKKELMYIYASTNK